jgi:hypothetical protein
MLIERLNAITVDPKLQAMIVLLASSSSPSSPRSCFAASS